MAGAGKGAAGGDDKKRFYRECIKISSKMKKIRCKLCSDACVDECLSNHDARCMFQSSLWRETDGAAMTGADFTATVAGRHKEHIDVCLLKRR